MIDLYSEASAIARNMLARYLETEPELRDQMPGANCARSAWEKVERELINEGWNDLVESSKLNPVQIPYELPRPLMKLMKKDDAFAGELRQLYDSFLTESSRDNFNVSQKVDHISSGGKVIGESIVNISINDITRDIVSSKPKPSEEIQPDS
jgi:hypothetical protein